MPIENPGYATDGEKNNIDSLNRGLFTNLEATTGTESYGNAKDVWLAYDFGKTEKVSQIKIYRHSYGNTSNTSNMQSTFKDVWVELSNKANFSDSQIVFKKVDIVDAGANKAKPQIINLEIPVAARFIRIHGKRHMGGWGGYSNKVRYAEIEVYADLIVDKTKLSQRISAADALVKSNYASSTWSAFWRLRQ